MPIRNELRIMNYELRTKIGIVQKKTPSRYSTQSGFTLIEMIVSIALFSFVMLATTTVLLSVVDANHKAQGLKTSINNLSLTLESIARNLRTGSSYVIGPSQGACPLSGRTSISYTDQYGLNVIYQQSGGSIEISKGGTSFAVMTAPEITIERFCFYVNGQDPLDPLQPKILITAGGIVNIASAAGARTKTTSRFDLQTLVSQRLP